MDRVWDAWGGDHGLVVQKLTTDKWRRKNGFKS
jgi:hypothetical protein